MTLPFVAVVSESFVKRYWPDQNPIGRHFNFGNSDRTVVGVAGEVRVRGLERTSEPQVYMPYQQLDKDDGISLNYAPEVAGGRAASGNASALAPALRRIIHEADPQLPISDVRMMSEIVDGADGGAARGGDYAFGVRGDCVSAGGDRDSRIAVVRGVEPDAGDRRADGAGRGARAIFWG